MTVNTFLFDIGRVLLDWDPRYLLNRILSDETEVSYFLTHICPQSWNEEQDKGRPWPEAVREALTRHPDHRETIETYWARWEETVAGPIAGSVAIFTTLKERGYPCYALSNFAVETFDLMARKYEFLNRFDGRIISGHEGVIKPDRRIYDLAVERFGLTPGTTLFIDDSPANTDAADSYGFQTHHFSTPYRLLDHLNSLGLAAS